MTPLNATALLPLQAHFQQHMLGAADATDLIAGGAEVHVDSEAMAAYLVKGDQWVSFDAPETMFMKIKAARAAGLGGVMVWAADYDTADHSMLTIIAWARANPEAATETLRMR